MGKISQTTYILEKIVTRTQRLHLILKYPSLQSVPWHFPKNSNSINVFQLPTPSHCLVIQHLSHPSQRNHNSQGKKGNKQLRSQKYRFCFINVARMRKKTVMIKYLKGAEPGKGKIQFVIVLKLVAFISSFFKCGCKFPTLSQGGLQINLQRTNKPQNKYLLPS